MGTPSATKQHPWRRHAAWDWVQVACAVPETPLSGQLEETRGRLSEWRGQKGAAGQPRAGSRWGEGRGTEHQEVICGAVPETGSPLEGHAQRGILRRNSCGVEARVCGLCGLRPGMKSPVLLPSLSRAQCQGPWQGQLHDSVCACMCMRVHMPEFGVSMGGWRW